MHAFSVLFSFSTVTTACENFSMFLLHQFSALYCLHYMNFSLLNPWLFLLTLIVYTREPFFKKKIGSKVLSKIAWFDRCMKTCCMLERMNIGKHQIYMLVVYRSVFGLLVTFEV